MHYITELVRCIQTIGDSTQNDRIINKLHDCLWSPKGRRADDIGYATFCVVKTKSYQSALLSPLNLPLDFTRGMKRAERTGSSLCQYKNKSSHKQLLAQHISWSSVSLLRLPKLLNNESHMILTNARESTLSTQMYFRHDATASKVCVPFLTDIRIGLN